MLMLNSNYVDYTEYSKMENMSLESEKKLQKSESALLEANLKLEEAKPWFEMKDEEKLKIAADKKAATDKADAAKKAEEDRIAAERKAEAEIGYNTGITFDNLARNPDDYLLKKVLFAGEVVQVMEGSTENQYRFAVNGDYNNMVYLSISKDKLSNNRILEDDYITIKGFSMRILEYESTMGASISIPAISVDIIER